jgi:O-antigen/teichoic acid export membrane protein
MVGQYALASAIAVPVMVFANMNLRGILVTEARAEYEPHHFVALRSLTSVMAVVFVIAGASLSGATSVTVLVIALVTIGQGATSMQDIYRGLMQRAERMDIAAVSAFLQAATTLAAAWLILRNAANLPAVLAAIALSRVLVLYLWDRPMARALTAAGLHPARVTRPYADRMTRAPAAVIHAVLAGVARQRGRDWTTLLRLARTAFPVGVAMLMSSIVASIPRYALKHYYGDVELGYFATLMAIPFAGTIVIAALGESAAPRLGRYRHTDRRGFRVLLGRLVAATLVLGAGGALLAWGFANPILTTMFRDEYTGREAAFVWVMIAGGATYLYSMLGYGVIAIGHFRAQLAVSTAVAVTTVGLSECFVPSYGVTGAAWAILAASLVGTLASIALVETALASTGFTSAGAMYDASPAARRSDD